MDIFKGKNNNNNLKETGSSTKAKLQTFHFVIPSQIKEKIKRHHFSPRLLFFFNSNKATPGGGSGLPGDYRYCNWLLLMFHTTQRCNYPLITITFVN